MARGEHPERTPLYGGLMIICAMVVSAVVTVTGTPVAVRIPVYLISLIAGLFGALLTLRDYS
jgi:UDP-N-acetylmuramyl pentapeptide phosphotransferase/UDP-N-acetylglucosamine-1-phosphate transferase